MRASEQARGRGAGLARAVATRVHTRRADCRWRVAFLVAVLLAACGDGKKANEATVTGGASGSGKVVTEQRSVPAFTALDVSASTEVRIAIGEPRSLAVTADDDIVPLIKTDVRDGRLVIRPERSYRPDARRPLVVLTVPRLNEVAMSGFTMMTISGLQEDELRVKTAGTADVEASGRAGRITIETAGSATIRFGGLSARSVEVRCTGAASVDVQVSESLTGRVAGSVSVTYSGSPTVAVEASGVSKVTKR